MGDMIIGFDPTASAPANRTNATTTELFQPFLGMEPDAFKELAGSILVCIPHRVSEGIHSSLFRSAGIWAILGTPVATIADQFSGFIELTRNGMVRTFLQYCQDNPKIEYMVMIDNDEAVEWDAPYRLAQWGKQIVSGIVCSFSSSKGGVFACITVEDKHGVARFPTTKRTKKLPSSGLKRIKSAGTGLLCVHKSVFLAMIEANQQPFEIPEKTRQECNISGTLKLGEDMAFSARAESLGFDMYVDFSVRAKHYKTMEISWPEEALDYSTNAADWEVADDDYCHT